MRLPGRFARFLIRVRVPKPTKGASTLLHFSDSLQAWKPCNSQTSREILPNKVFRILHPAEVTMEEKKTRREFIQASTAVAGSMALNSSILGQTSGSSLGIPTRILGRTGVPVSMICIGGWHIGAVQDK